MVGDPGRGFPVQHLIWLAPCETIRHGIPSTSTEMLSALIPNPVPRIVSVVYLPGHCHVCSMCACVCVCVCVCGGGGGGGGVVYVIP